VNVLYSGPAGSAKRRDFLALAALFPIALRAEDHMESNELVQWELLWEIKRFHQMEREEQLSEISRRLQELVDDEGSAALEARQRIRSEIANLQEISATLRREVQRLRKELTLIEQKPGLLPKR
jgi:hypothetical protein